MCSSSHSPERPRVALGQAHVFVEVKRLDSRPVDPLRAREGGEELVLRGSRREHDAGAVGARQRRAEPGRGVIGRGGAQGRPVGKDDGAQEIALQLDHACSGTKTTKNT